jgi:hypothetical protein
MALILKHFLGTIVAEIERCISEVFRKTNHFKGLPLTHIQIPPNEVKGKNRKIVKQSYWPSPMGLRCFSSFPEGRTMESLRML